jgi:hypothetical protein
MVTDVNRIIGDTRTYVIDGTFLENEPHGPSPELSLVVERLNEKITMIHLAVYAIRVLNNKVTVFYLPEVVSDVELDIYIRRILDLEASAGGVLEHLYGRQVIKNVHKGTEELTNLLAARMRHAAKQAGKQLWVNAREAQVAQPGSNAGLADMMSALGCLLRLVTL